MDAEGTSPTLPERDPLPEQGAERSEATSEATWSDPGRCKKCDRWLEIRCPVDGPLSEEEEEGKFILEEGVVVLGGFPYRVIVQSPFEVLNVRLEPFNESAEVRDEG